MELKTQCHVEMNRCSSPLCTASGSNIVRKLDYCCVFETNHPSLIFTAIFFHMYARMCASVCVWVCVVSVLCVCVSVFVPPSVSLTTRTGSQVCSLHSVGKKRTTTKKTSWAQNPGPQLDTLPQSPPPPHYCSTWPRVSGSLRATKLPAARAPEAKRMGTALVMPTNEVKMLIPRTAASLQSALRNPNAVVLSKRRTGEGRSQASGFYRSSRLFGRTLIGSTNEPNIIWISWNPQKHLVRNQIKNTK